MMRISANGLELLWSRAGHWIGGVRAGGLIVEAAMRVNRAAISTPGGVSVSGSEDAAAQLRSPAAIRAEQGDGEDPGPHDAVGTPQRTSRCAAPTYATRTTGARVMAWVADTGMPREVARNSDRTAGFGTEAPTGFSLVMRWPG